MRVALVLVAALAAIPLAAAHSGGSLAAGDSLATATPLGAPGYAFAEPGEGVDVHYYRIEGDGALRIRLVAPQGREPSEAPVLLLFGPSFPENASAPADVERPATGGGVAFLAGGREPADLAPLGLRVSVLLDRTFSLEAGAHVLVVRSASAAPLALVLAAPGGGWIELLTTPGLRDDARVWSGAPVWPAIVAATAAAGLVGLLAWRWRARPWSLHALAAFGGGALVLGTGAALGTDAARTGAGWLHAIGALAAAAIAMASTRPALARPSWWQRALLLAAGALAFVLQAGALWGPIAMLAGALLPEPSEKPTA